MSVWTENQFGELYNPDTLLFSDSIDCGMIINGLYLGSYHLGASMLEGLKLLGVNAILTVGGKMPPKFPKSEIEYMVVPMDDDPSVDISLHFNKCFDFIDNALSDPKGVVFIHCYAGISRSATMTIMYLMKSKKMSYIEATETVRQARYWIQPNSGFRNKLHNLNKESENKDTREKMQLYEQCFSLLRSYNQGKNKLKESEKSFIAQSYIEIFGKYHRNVEKIKLELL